MKDPAIVEAIVREVLFRLSASRNVHENLAERLAEPRSGTGVEIADRVITLETLRGRLDGIEQLVVTSEAIVTPAARDELKSRKIVLKTVSKNPATVESGAQSICLARLNDHFVPLEWLKKVGVNQVCCGEDYLHLAEQLSRDHAFAKSICLAAQPFVAVSMLNRNENIRAAFARTARDVSEVCSTLNANVLVLDRVQNRHELLTLISDFTGQRRGGSA